MRKKIKMRSLFLGGIFAMLFLTVIARVYWVQAIEAPELLEKAKHMWQQNRILTPVRGTIYDRNMHVLAQDGPSYTVAVNPKLIHEQGSAERVVDQLAPYLGMEDAAGRDKLRDIVTGQNQNGEFYVNREVRNEGWKLDADIATDIDKMIKEESLSGVYLLEQTKRYYPSNDLASHILGYQDKEGNSVMGLESLYNERLSGTEGKIHFETDRLGYETPGSHVVYEPAVNGKAMRLTIDENIQLFMEQALEQAYDAYHPISATAIAVNPQTMEILGLANYPDFNPNEYWEADGSADFYNHAVGSQYEPGSTFKIVTLAAAVEEGVFNPNETFQSGQIRVPGATLHDHNGGMGWGEITYLEGLKRSSNVSFVKLGYEKLGEQRFEQYIHDFGFGQLTGIDMPGETSGIVRMNRPAEYATATFGQGMTATAIQQIAAISVIANGGKLMKPFIVKEIIDPETDEVLEQRSPEVVRQVIREETAKEVGEMLEQVISDHEIGTGRLAYLEDYRMAGKTGTAQKVVNGKYSTSKWVISFVGYAPLENPQIALFVSLDEPEMQGDYRNASPIVATVFREIMQKSLRYLGVPEEGNEDASTPSTTVRNEVPNLLAQSLLAVENELARNNYPHILLGEGSKVLKQYPEPGHSIHPGQTIYLLTEPPEKVTLPDLAGKSMRDALQLCAMLEVTCEVEGEGYVVSQKRAHQSGKQTWKLTLSSTIEDEVSGESSEE